MSMTIAEAIKQLDGANAMLFNRNMKTFNSAIIMAIAALREKAEREDPKPLTIEELRRLDEEPVWVKAKKAKAGYGMWCVVNYNRLTRRVEAFIPGIENTWFEGEEYGKTWLAYRHKPKEE